MECAIDYWIRVLGGPVFLVVGECCAQIEIDRFTDDREGLRQPSRADREGADLRVHRDREGGQRTFVRDLGRKDLGVVLVVDNVFVD